MNDRRLSTTEGEPAMTTIRMTLVIALGVAACAPTFQTDRQRSAYAAFDQCQKSAFALDVHVVRIDPDGTIVYRGRDDDPAVQQVGRCLTSAGHAWTAMTEHEEEVEGAGSK
jgi:hypothetical protein